MATSRTAGFWPHAIVLVVTVRPPKFHGGVQAADAGGADAIALGRGMENLYKHLENVRQFGIEPIIMVNARAEDPPEEIHYLVDHLLREQVEAGAADVFRRGGEGAMEIAQRILARARAATPRPRYIYDLTDPPMEKVRRIARAICGAEDVDFSVTAKKQLDRAEALGLGELPICIAKTHLSLHRGLARTS